MKDSLNSKSKTALLWSFSGSLIKQVVFLFISIIIARILGPEKIGIVAMSVVFISISGMLIDSGFTSGLIQQEESKDITYSSVFYFNLFLSVLLSLIIVLLADKISVFLEEPRVKSILYYLAIIPPVSALGIVQAAILKREIDFKNLTIIDIVSNIVGGIFGVIAAYLGYGVYSLVIQQILTVLIGTIMLWFTTKWIPKLEFSFLEIQQLYQFSGYVFLDTLFQRVFKHIDTIFIAKAFSPVVLGFYSKADSLKAQVVAYATNSISKVMYPVFSRLQNDERAFKATYFKTFNIVTGLVVLLVAPLFFLGHFIIIFLLGEEWEPSVVLFQILILTALTNPHVSMMSRAILSKGYSKLMFKIGMISRFIKLLPIVAGLMYGIQEFTIAMLVASVIIFIMLSFFVYKKLNINFWAQLKNILKPNMVFIVFILANYFFLFKINTFYLVAVFLVCHIIFIISIKHDSYIFIKHNIIKLLNNE